MRYNDDLRSRSDRIIDILFISLAGGAGALMAVYLLVLAILSAVGTDPSAGL